MEFHSGTYLLFQKIQIFKDKKKMWLMPDLKLKSFRENASL